MRFFVVAAVLSLAGCGSTAGVNKKDQIANPASEHCVKAGGRLEIRNEAGGQAGYCHLPDGRIVEEWKLFRESGGKASPARS